MTCPRQVLVFVAFVFIEQLQFSFVAFVFKNNDVLVDVTFKILGWGERAACWFCDWSKMITSQLLAVGR